jgi:transcriptional regulator with XRE-family HTH domain
VTTSVGPGLRRRVLAQALHELRLRAGKEQVEAAEVLGCSRSRISHLESTQRSSVMPGKLELPALLILYGATDRLQELEDLRSHANERGWWSEYGLSSELQSFIGLEADASVISCFSLELVPGLIQTREYAKATYARHGTPDSDLDYQVSARMRRQTRVGSAGLKLSVVVSEAVLHRTRCMADYGLDQLRFLRDVADSPNVEVRVLPFDVGGHRSMTGSFTLLDFPSNLAEPVAYREATLYGDMTDNQDQVRELRHLYDDLYTLSDDVTVTGLLESFF